MAVHRLTGAALACACACAPQFALAEVYTWVDASGAVTVSNLAPPADVRVINVTRASPPSAQTVRDSARNAQIAELTDRVQQLERDVQIARSAPPDIVYPVMPPPPMQQYPAAFAPYAEAPQPVEMPASWGYGCDPTWAGCWASMAPFYAAPIVVVGAASGRHGHRRAGHGFGPRRPVQQPVGLVPPLTPPVRARTR